MESRKVVLVDINNPTAAEYSAIARIIAMDSSICKIGNVHAAIATAITSRDECRINIVNQLNYAAVGHVVLAPVGGRVLSITRAEAAPFIANAQNLANDFDVLIAQLLSIVYLYP